MRAPTALALACLALAPTLAACGGDGTAPGETTETITFNRSGGLAGIDQNLEISPDGQVIVSVDGAKPRPAEVDRGLVAAAQDAVAAIDFDDLPGGPSDPIPDDFTFSLTYGEERTGGGAVALPENSPLRPALGALTTVLEVAAEAREQG